MYTVQRVRKSARTTKHESMKRGLRRRVIDDSNELRLGEPLSLKPRKAIVDFFFEGFARPRVA